MHPFTACTFLLLFFAALVSSTKLESMTIQHVLVPIVMEAEAKPFVEHLGLESVEGFFPPHTPFLAYQGEHHSCKVTVVTMGKDTVYGTGMDNVGTTSAALGTFLALSRSEADGNPAQLVMNAGTCGGFQRQGGGIGDVYLTTGVAHHDRRIPIPGFDVYGIGKLETLNPTTMAKTLGYKTGICTTGNSLDWVEKDDEFMKDSNASCKDMEAASIAWIAKMHDVPYLGVKVVTDIVDGPHPTQDEFLENLHSAAKSLQDALPKVLEYVTDKTGQSDQEL
ncbi:phosphorylase superfamily protein [Nitzschia inconspicua]|uniref:Phosphorylase superfamily protein n=1 Tax=Nitzschia inconspicua TaxID=303405 RepID=A0A9K3Q7G4_9STRA|nr:phosphorylase superfamily protein [Nitzschia inconspicua]